MFLRLGWVVGQAGILLACLIIFLSKVVTTLTALSLCAICTNGEVKGGGVYFLISRALGPIYGGVIGILFYLAQAVATSMYAIGFAESLVELFQTAGVGLITGDELNDIRLIGVATTCILLAVAMVGVGWYAKCQVGLLVTLLIAMFAVMIGAFFPGVTDRTANEEAGFVGFGSRNIGPSFTADPATPGVTQNFFTVFAVFFPAATGVMAGANLSGDLKDPSHAIPKGTLGAIGVTFVSYIGLVWIIGSVALVCADLPTQDYCANADTAASTGLIPYGGLLFNKLIMQYISIWSPIFYVGVFAATLSSALASLVGAPRILQSVASDKVFPCAWFNYFGAGRGTNNEPVRAYVLTFLITCGCCLIGKLDVIAPLISNFFMISYAFTNYACFASSMAKYPGWRPSFKWYNRWLSLVGFFICIAVMFLMDWVTALITVILSALIYGYLLWLDPAVNWGAAGDARQYFSVLKNMGDLQRSSNQHVKTFRPQYLVMSGPPKERSSLIKFVSLLSKGGGITIFGDVVLKGDLQSSIEKNEARKIGRVVRSGSVRLEETETPDEDSHAHSEFASNLAAGLAMVHQRRDSGDNYLLSRKVWGNQRPRGAFFEAVIADSLLGGFESLLQTAGVGSMRPNTVIIGFKTKWREASQTDLKAYEQMIRVTLSSHLGVMIVRDDNNLFDISTSTPSKFASKYCCCAKSTGNNMEEFDDDDEGNDYVAEGDLEIQMDTNRDLVDNSSHSLATVPKLKGDTIDVWWVSDDGGLTMLVPYLLSQHRILRKHQNLRVLTITDYNVQETSKLHKTEVRMVHLLKKFRIAATVAAINANLNSVPNTDTISEFEALGKVSIDGLTPEETRKTHRVLRLVELLRERTTSSTTSIFITLPLPDTGIPVGLYTSWLHILSTNMPPMVMMRGNNENVLTFIC